MSTARVRLPRKLAKSVSGGVLAEAGRLHPVGSLGITLNLQPLSRVTMTLAEDDLPLAMHDLVEVYNQNGSVGIYRVVKVTSTYRKERKIELSHGLDVFSDATLATIQDWSGTVAQFLQMIIDGQTQTIGGQFYWRLGRCDDTSYWEKDIKYDNAMSCLTDIAKTEEDYMFTFDQSTFPWTLNFVRRDATVLSEFRLNRNTSSCAVALDDSDLCTRLYLSVSKESEDSAGNGTYWEEGYFTYNDTAAQASFGIVSKTAGVDQSVSAPEIDKETWVAQYFSRHNTPNVQITIDGAELNRRTGESFDEVHLGRICRVALPDYDTIFNERVISVNYPDALRSPASVKVSLANKRLTAEDAFSEISDTATSAASSAKSGGRGSHNDATYFRRVIGDTANGLYSRIEQTAYYIRSEVFDTANGLYSRIEQTASYIRSEVANTANGLRSEIEQTASHIRAEVSDTANGLYSKIEETASYIRSEVSNAANGLYSRIEQTASEIRSEVSNTANGLNSKIDQTASYIRSEVSQTANGLSSRIDQNASQIALKVAIGDVATQLAVEAGNVSISGGNLVVDGYVTTSGLAAEIAKITTVSVQALSAVSVASNSVYASTIGFSENQKINLYDASVSGNTLTLFRHSGGNLTFSKATTLTGDWSGSAAAGKAYKVTASPQGNTHYSPQINHAYMSGDKTWADDKKSFTQDILVTDENGVEILKRSTTFTTTESYTAGVTEGEGKFEQATVTPQGASHPVTPITTSGAIQVLAAQSITPISTTYVELGTETELTPISGSALSGKKVKSGISAYSITPVSGGGYITPISGSAVPKQGTKVAIALYDSDGVRYNTSSHPVYLAGSGSYYAAGSRVYRYQAGDAVSVYNASDLEDFSGYYKAGTKASYYPKKSGGTKYYRPSTAGTYYPATESGGTTYYKAGSKLYLYDAGTEDKTTYYTKKS